MKRYTLLACVLAGMAFGMANLALADVVDNTTHATTATHAITSPAVDDPGLALAGEGMLNAVALMGSLDVVTADADDSAVSSLFESPLVGGLGLDWLFTGHLYPARHGNTTSVASAAPSSEVGDPGSRLSGLGPLAPSRDERMPLIIS